jgi:hypothetical protein
MLHVRVQQHCGVTFLSYSARALSRFLAFSLFSLPRSLAPLLHRSLAQCAGKTAAALRRSAGAGQTDDGEKRRSGGAICPGLRVFGGAEALPPGR